jgi:hypothetical protein
MQAAVRTGDGIIHTLPRPARHHTIIHALHALGHPQCACCTDGFLLSDGTFADRGEAEKIALGAGQVRGGKIIGGSLTSEDMW